MKMQLPYDEGKMLEYARGNPNLMAKKIIGADADDVATYNLINKVREYLFSSSSFESLKCFNEELKRLGWGKEE